MDPFADSTAGAGSIATLSQPEKAAAVLLAMGKPVAGKLLKFFEQDELQVIIRKAQSLRTIPPHELVLLVNEFEDLFSEGAGLMDNAKAMEGILEEGLPPDEVDGLLGRRTQFQGLELTVWDRLQETDPEMVGEFLASEHPQTAAYVVSMLPSPFAGQTLLKLPDETRIDILHRAVNLKPVNPRAASIIEKRVEELMTLFREERNGPGTIKVAEIMNELPKEHVEDLLGRLETVSRTDVERVRPRVFLFDDVQYMPARSRVALFNDISSDVITMALRGAEDNLREAVLSSVGQRQRRMIESDLAAGDEGINPRDIAMARRTITQEAIRMADQSDLKLREVSAPAAAPKAA